MNAGVALSRGHNESYGLGTIRLGRNETGTSNAIVSSRALRGVQKWKSGVGESASTNCVHTEYATKGARPESMQGRKCCAGCGHCPRWGTGDTLRVLGANHKTGTFLALHVMQSVRLAAIEDACVLASQTLVSVHWQGLDECKGCGDFANRPTRVMAMVRDPFELIVSGYLYHAAAKEKWCAEPMRVGQQGTSKWKQVGKGAKEFGLAKLIKCKEDPQCPVTIEPGHRGYDKYLKSISMRQGLLAEFVRASMRDLPALELAYRTTSGSTAEKKSSFVCLDSFTAPKNESRDPYRETWTKIFEFWDYPAKAIGPAVVQAQKHDIIKRPQALGGHGTLKDGKNANSDDYRGHLFAVAVDVDREYFGGRYAQLAANLKCPQPSDRGPHVDGGGSDVGWDGKPLK